MVDYGFIKELDISFDDTVKKATEALKKDGFSHAYHELQAEANIGLMLPCNVIVYEKNGKTVVSVIKPTVAMQMIQNEELGKLAREVEDKLKRAFDSME